MVIPKEGIEEAYQNSMERTRFEDEIIDRIRDGVSTLDLLTLREI